MYFCVFTVEYIALTCKSNGSLMLCFSIVSSNCQAFDPSSCFVCFNCEENSSLKSVFVEPFVGILKCMLKKKSIMSNCTKKIKIKE